MNSIGYYKEVRIMKLEAKVNFDRFEEALQVVDAHTAGEFCVWSSEDFLSQKAAQ